MNSPYQWWVLNRLTDVGGVSGTGHVAYALELRDGDTHMLWDTGWPTTEWLPDIATAMEIHGHDGKTRFEQLDPFAASRGRELLAAAYPRMVRSHIALAEVIHACLTSTHDNT